MSFKIDRPKPLHHLNNGENTSSGPSDNSSPGLNDTCKSTLCNTQYIGNNYAAPWRDKVVYDLDESNNLDYTNAPYFQEQNESISYEGAWRIMPTTCL